MSDQEQKNTETDEKTAQINFHYIKSNNFRVVHADGAHGGVTPRGDIHMALFNERNPIPVRITNKIAENGTLGEEIGRSMRDGIVREVEVDVILDPEVAKSIANWLLEKADEATSNQKQPIKDR